MYEIVVEHKHEEGRRIVVVAPVVLEVELDCGRTLTFLADAVGESNDFVAHEFGLDRQYAEHRPISVAVIRTRRELIYYACEESLEFAEFLVVGQRSVEQGLVVSVEELVFEFVRTSEFARIFVAVFECVIEVFERFSDVAESKVASRACAHYVSEHSRFTLLDFAAVRELIVKTSLAFESFERTVGSHVDIEVSHNVALHITELFAALQRLFVLFEKSADNLGYIAGRQTVGEKLLNVGSVIHAEVGDVVKIQVLFCGDFVFYVDAVVNGVEKLGYLKIGVHFAKRRNLLFAEHLDRLVTHIADRLMID